MHDWNSDKNVNIQHSVSPRELEVLNMISFGYSTKDIAGNLFISNETVRTHRKHLLRKFSANNMAALVRKALECGVI